MKVLLINRNDFVDGGADRVFLNTFDLLQVAGSKFHAGKFTRADVELDKVDIRNLSVWGKLKLVKDYLYNRKVEKALVNRIRAIKPDVAHVHLIFGTLSVSVLRVLKQYEVPVVMTLHDYRLICPANAMLDRHGKVCERCRGKMYFNCLIFRCSEGNVFYSTVIMLEAYMRTFLLRPLKLVDHFIFVSQFAKNKHLEFEPRFALKSTHLYNMNVPVHETTVTKGNYVLFFGRLSREKGISTLIRASQMANARVIIAGTGPQEEDIKRQIDFRTIGPEKGEMRVEFVGFKSGDELKSLIQNCSFVVVPSEWYENNPMTVVEAFSQGKPVIGSNIGGIPELVTPDNGFLFESGNPESLSDALRKAEDMPFEEYERMCSACRQFAAGHFDRSLHFERLTGIYQQVANGL